MSLPKQYSETLPPAPAYHHGFLRRHRNFAAWCFSIMFIACVWIHPPQWQQTRIVRLLGNDITQELSGDICPQVSPLNPQHSTLQLDEMDEFLKSSEFQNMSVRRLSEAVQIPTQSFDDMGLIGEDKRWEVFYAFESYLLKTFPLIHANLELDAVNEHGLVYTWKGTNATLKPTLLMAHQDVVPVPDSTIGAWTYPPFGGVFDGKFVWGRGAKDCKDQLFAIMDSIELLLGSGFQPQRTVVLSFGFDEEISGREGAGHLAPYLLKRFGKDGVAVIIDEGAGISTLWGSAFATPGVAEKGYVDVEIVVRMPGGHSSIPPAHNGIGVMSELITDIERNPYNPRLSEDNPVLGLLQCGASYGSNFPPKLKKLLRSRSGQSRCKEDKLAQEASKESLAARYLMTTSVAVDLIQGGVKVNALPERTSATVNHRVNIGEHPSDVKAKLKQLAESIAERHNLTVHAFDGAEETLSSITLRASDTELEPAPVTPTIIKPISAYFILSGTTRAIYGQDVLVAPGMTTGNTDTRYYWDLSRNIFRFGPGWDPEDEGLGNIHTVDERASAKAHVVSTRWFILFIRNMDESDLP